MAPEQVFLCNSAAQKRHDASSLMTDLMQKDENKAVAVTVTVVLGHIKRLIISFHYV